MRPAGELCHPKKVALVQLTAVGRRCVDLVGAVETSCQPVAGPPRRVTGHGEDFSAFDRPVSLHSDEWTAKIEDEVTTASLADRSIHLDIQLDRGGGDPHLRDRAFLVRRQFRQHA